MEDVMAKVTGGYVENAVLVPEQAEQAPDTLTEDETREFYLAVSMHALNDFMHNHWSACRLYLDEKAALAAAEQRLSRATGRDAVVILHGQQIVKLPERPVEVKRLGR